jgi:subtilase family serine protease
MRKAKIAALATAAAAATVAAVLTATAVATPAVSATRSASAASGPPASPPRIVLKPGVSPLTVKGERGPFTYAECEQTYGIACYVPSQIRAAYNLPAVYARGVTGKGTTIVIVDSFGSPTIRADLAVFDKQFGIQAPPSFKIITPVGTFKYNAGDSGWAGETTLDVEYAHALAPGANILLVETPVSETEGVTGFPQIVKAEEYVVNHNLGDVISQSFSATEQTFAGGLGQINRYHLRDAYEDAYRHHVTVLAASGDDGATDVELNGTTYYTHPVTSWPDSDPLVTAVGGTQLILSGGKYSSVAWNDTTNSSATGSAQPTPNASGGGKSVFFTRPSYQNGVASVVGDRRGVPDISMSGACSGPVNVYSTYAGTPAGWSLICGTSEATPEFAAIVALADQLVPTHKLGLINPRLYALSAAHAPGIVDVTSGNNTVSFYQGGKYYTVKGFSARRGYSLVTGVGTINALSFVYELAKG